MFTLPWRSSRWERGPIACLASLVQGLFFSFRGRTAAAAREREEGGMAWMKRTEGRARTALLLRSSRNRIYHRSAGLCVSRKPAPSPCPLRRRKEKPRHHSLPRRLLFPQVPLHRVHGQRRRSRSSASARARGTAGRVPRVSARGVHGRHECSSVPALGRGRQRHRCGWAHPLRGPDSDQPRAAAPDGQEFEISKISRILCLKSKALFAFLLIHHYVVR